MRKLFTKILISAVMVAIFLAPVSTSFQKNKEGDLAIIPKINTALAQTPAAICTPTSATRCFNLGTITQTDKTADINLKIFTAGGVNQLIVSLSTDLGHTYTIQSARTIAPDAALQDIHVLFGLGKGTIPDIDLTPNTVYFVQIKLEDTISYTQFTTNGANNTTPTVNTTPTNVGGTGVTDVGFGCSALDATTWFRQCLVGAVYYMIFEPIAWVAKGAAAVLDFFVYYSTQSASYSSGLIGSAWASVRDIANIFFIIALLYVAIQTILGMGHGGKQMIATIVVVALLINFSLFFTEVIIDASNILAKVFYTHIKPIDANGKDLPAGSAGQKSITVNLVHVFDPQTLIANKAEQPGMTFIIILISIALMVFMIIIFLSVAILFVGRVAGLWIAMIFAPIAFASYTLPFDIPGFGHREWWDSLLKQAFLAPIFIFFLYIILLLGDSFKLIAYDYKTSDGVLDGVMKVVIPFMLVFILLQQAKKLAVTYSGEMGAAFTKVGGFAMGAVGGAAALVGTAGIGKLAGLAAKSTVLQETAEKKGMAGFGARMALRTADYGTKATFDIRKSPVGSMLASQGMDLKSGTSMIGLGENVTTGGYKGVVAKRQEAIEKEKELYKTKMTDPEVKTWSEKKEKEYDLKKTAEQQRLGVKFDSKIFEEMNGKRPEFTTAAQLNRARLVTFKENIGKTGIIHSAASSIVAKVNPVTPEQLKAEQAKNPMVTFASLTDSRVKKTKLAIGIAATVATGGLGGAGALAGLGAGGGAYALNEFTLNKDAEKGAQGAIAKEIEKNDKTEKEMATLKARKNRLDKVITDMKTEAGIKEDDKDASTKLEDYINTKLANVESDFTNAKAEETIYRNSRITKEGEKISVSANPRYKPEEKEDMLEKIEKEITDFSAKEVTAKNNAIKIMKDKQIYTTAKSAEKDLISVTTRIETVEGKAAHPKEAHGADGGIKDAAKASGGGGGGGGHAKPAAGGGGGGHH